MLMTMGSNFELFPAIFFKIIPPKFAVFGTSSGSEWTNFWVYKAEMWNVDFFHNPFLPIQFNAYK